MRKVPVTEFGICSYCKRRADCAMSSRRKLACPSTDETVRFKADVSRKKKVNEFHEKEVAEFLSGLKKTDKSQVKIYADFTIGYTPKSRETRIRNSRNWKVLLVDGGNDEYSKWCENCGSGFRTMTADRHLCDECWDEICNKLGVSYASIGCPRTRGRAVSE